MIILIYPIAFPLLNYHLGVVMKTSNASDCFQDSSMFEASSNIENFENSK